MPDMIWKTYRAEVKGFDEKTGEVDMFIPVSSMSVDRDGEVVEPAAFKKTLPKFMKRPVLVASHDYKDLTNQIGEWSRLKIGAAGMDGKPKYYIGEGNAQADWGFKLASKGMAAFSIGFIPTKWEDGDGTKAPRRTYQEVELLEISQVIVPSNRDAIQGLRSVSTDSVVKGLIDDIINAEIVDLTTEPVVTKPEETMNMIRMPVPAEVGKHDGHKIRTIDISTEEGIKALYCVTDKVVMTYLFEKDKWDMEKARAWMHDHMGKGAHEISQSEIIDEIDYLSLMIDEVGLNDDATNALRELTKRLPADDIAVKDIAVKDTAIVVDNTAKLTNQDILESIKRIIGGK